MTTEWNGEGLPPVGCVVEYVPDPTCAPNNTVRGVFIGRVNGEDFVDTGLSVDRMNAIDPARRFRPLRTKEQQDQRDLAMLIVESKDQTGVGIAKAIISAGWRKGELCTQPPP